MEGGRRCISARRGCPAGCEGETATESERAARAGPTKPEKPSAVNDPYMRLRAKARVQVTTAGLIAADRTEKTLGDPFCEEREMHFTERRKEKEQEEMNAPKEFEV